jgi:hypothetical protein
MPTPVLHPVGDRVGLLIGVRVRLPIGVRVRLPIALRDRVAAGRPTIPPQVGNCDAVPNKIFV